PSTIRRTGADKVFDTVNVIIMALLLLVTIYPLYFVLIASISDPFEVVQGNVFLYPKGFSLDAYKNVFDEPRIWIGYRNTIFYTITGTLFSLFLTIPSAYALSKKSLPGRSLLNIYFLIPMYFSGGLIPTYLVIKSMQLVNRWYSLIFIGASSVYNMIVTRVYFQSNVPEELYESARIDGASEIKTFVSIAMPLVMPIVAVMTLFFAVARWNDYFNALVYVTKNDYLPLQMVLRSILLHSATALENLDTSSMDANAVKQAARLSYMAEAMKYALIIVASLPLLVAYPFVQKHFVKGMLIGAIKG
ncbi:MAG: carbohydrate ABC transporter permease, partial [Christensenellales bacterium]